MSKEIGRTKLRTKTGCLTCRARRKKCDETYPACQSCTSSLRRCQWPTSDELTDRRHASNRSRKSASPTPARAPPIAGNGFELSDNSALEQLSPTDTSLCLLSESTAHQLLRHDLESVISRHFVENYYSLLILPNCNPEFYWGWITDIQKLMLQYKSLRNSMLACGASHLHFIDASSSMQELSLVYYSNSLKGLSELLGGVSQLENDNGLLTSVILLYLHGCMGRGTYTDIPRHVNAAIRIIRLRLLSSPRNISRPFDRLAVESVLYQIFLVTTGSWSDPIELDYHFDTEFWLQAERLLAQSNLFPNHSISFNSPVIGVPLALFRIVLSLKQLYQNPWEHDRETLDQLRTELEEWEGVVLSEQDPDPVSEAEQPTCSPRVYKDAAYLYVLTSSLLMEQLSVGEGTPGPPQAAPKDSWQVKKIIQILREHQHDDEWSRCFIGNWPVYSVGFFMSSPDDIELVRGDLQRRWDLVKFSQITRFRQDLESTWSARADDTHHLSWPGAFPMIMGRTPCT